VSGRTLAMLVAALGVSCAALIGIEDAEVDPTLELGGPGAQGGSATGGGGASAGRGGQGAEVGTGGSAGSAGGEADGSVAEALCEQYCATVQANCTEDGTTNHAVYFSEAICLAACSAFADGSPGDELGNTVHCRLTQAQLAASTGEPDEHCPAAGPGGASFCGEHCEGFCTMMARFCPGFGSFADCMQECPGIPDIGGYNIGIQSGDSIQCRFYHVSAATQAPSVHCPHAAGALPCR
jgi:hypothetical protein